MTQLDSGVKPTGTFHLKYRQSQLSPVLMAAAASDIVVL